jgi:hypothetical protein
MTTDNNEIKSVTQTPLLRIAVSSGAIFDTAAHCAWPEDNDGTWDAMKNECGLTPFDRVMRWVDAMGLMADRPANRTRAIRFAGASVC